VKAQPQDGGQGGASARPGKDGGNGPGGGPGKGEGPGGNGDNQAVVKPPENHDADLMAAWVADCKKKVRMLARTPELAKEKGHNGKVSFSFVVGKRGRLISVSVNGGASFSELQEECREATRVASNSFKPFPAGVQAEQWTVNMSLSFPIQ
jgi:TonB family protein